MPAPAGSSTLFAHLSNHHDSFVQRIPDSATLAYWAVSAIFCYYLLGYIGLLPFTFSQAIWSIIVFITPSRIVWALDTGGPEQDTDSEGVKGFENKGYWTAKSEAMQRILGLDSPSFLAKFPAAKKFPGISPTLLGSPANNPPGLGNWDNSCYQNSIIQGFASLRSLDLFLKSNIEHLGHLDLFSTHTALKAIIDKLNDREYSGRKLWTPPELKSMCSWQQQDAQEYFSKVVDQIDKEIRQASKGLASKIGLELGPLEKDVLERPTKQAWKKEQIDQILEAVENKDSASLFSNPLEGLLAQRVGCMDCGYTEGLSLIPFNCLTVSLGRRWEYDIRQCLDEYTALEPIEGVECGKCTLLRTRAQLEQLLSQIEEDAEIGKEPSAPGLIEALKGSATTRLKAVEEALQNEDFSEKTLAEKCHIPSRSRVASTKSRQAVIGRAPKSLVVHVNRSVFDELTGFLTKNHADVRFPKVLNLNQWCLGTRTFSDTADDAETWTTNPAESMIPQPGSKARAANGLYELRAVITHYGRHENGHYICYRKYPIESFPVPFSHGEPEGEEQAGEHWFRLSDEDVALVSEGCVLSQGGVFMLFYERVDEPTSDTGDERPSVEGKENINQAQDLEDGIALHQLSNVNGQHPPLSETKNVGAPEAGPTSYSSRSSDSPVIDSSSPSLASQGSDTSSLPDENTPTVRNMVPAPAMRTATMSDEQDEETHNTLGPSLISSSMVSAR